MAIASLPAQKVGNWYQAPICLLLIKLNDRLRLRLRPRLVDVAGTAGVDTV